MPSQIFIAVLFAAALHATWNALIKRGGDKLLGTVLIAGGSALLAAVALPVLPQPAAASWPFIAISAGLNVIYYALLARAYHLADMSQAYPLMRGAAPLLVALASTLVLGEHLPAGAWAGICAICAGIAGMAAHGARGGGRAVALALLNAVVIAGYTLVDGNGARRSAAPVAYTLWVFLLAGLPLIAWAALSRRDALAGYLRGHWHLGLIGGAGSVVSYALALWAMTRVPVALVAALRETSILFGTLISGLVLKEAVGRARLAAACVIAAGAMALRAL